MAAALLTFLRRNVQWPVLVAGTDHTELPGRASWRLPRWVGAVVLVALIVFLRRPDVWLSPQFFQEDGLFFEQNYHHGWRAFFLPYSGYLHTALRLAVWVLGFLPFVLQPAFFNATAMAVCLAITVRLFRPGIRLPHKTLLAVVIVLVPRDPLGEILGNLNNIQWFLAFVPLLMLIEDAAPTGWRAAWDLGQLVLVGLTGPFALLSTPLFAAKWLCVARTRWNAACLGTTVSCGMVQAWFIHRQFDAPILTPTLHQWLTFFTWRFIGPLFYSRAFCLEYLRPNAAAAMLVGLGALLVTLNRRRPTWLWPTVVCTIFGGSVLLGTASRFLRDPVSFMEVSNGERYFFLPRVLLLWCLLLHLRAHVGWQRWLLWMVLTMAALAAATDFFCRELPAPRWTEQVQAFERGETDVLCTYPKWRLFLHRPSVRDERYSDALGEAPLEMVPPKNAVRIYVDGRLFVQLRSASDPIVYEIPPDSRVVAGRYAAASATAGAVKFAVVCCASDGYETRVLWRNQLDPSRFPADGGTHDFEAALPAHAVGRIALVSQPAQDGAPGGGWADVHFR